MRVIISSMKCVFHRAIICFFSIILLSGCKRSTEPISKTDFAMDTVVNISIYDDIPKDEAEEILDGCISEIRRYEGLFSTEIKDSDVSRINVSHGEKVSIHKETAELIEKALYYSSLSDGAFDITIRPVSELWDFRSGKAEIPEDKKIKEALSHVGYRNIDLDTANLFIKLKDPDAEIDLGAIAKGYTGDRIKEFLKGKGIKSAIINLGGNVVLLGSRPDGKPFKVGIEKPFGKEGEINDTLSVEDASVVTSGNYERYFEKDGKVYHHILDTKTGYPVESGLNAVTIVSGRSVDGDALSTACFCLGKEKAEELLKKINDDSIDVYFYSADQPLFL